MTSGGLQTSGTASKSTRHLGVHHRHHLARSSEVARMLQDVGHRNRGPRKERVRTSLFDKSTISALMHDISLTWTPYKPNQTIREICGQSLASFSGRPPSAPRTSPRRGPPLLPPCSPRATPPRRRGPWSRPPIPPILLLSHRTQRQGKGPRARGAGEKNNIYILKFVFFGGNLVTLSSSSSSPCSSSLSTLAQCHSVGLADTEGGFVLLRLGIIAVIR